MIGYVRKIVVELRHEQNENCTVSALRVTQFHQGKRTGGGLSYTNNYFNLEYTAL